MRCEARFRPSKRSVDVKGASHAGMPPLSCASPGISLGEIPLGPREGSYLVDPASSHMLVSKIKPCMSKYERFSP